MTNGVLIAAPKTNPGTLKVMVVDIGSGVKSDTGMRIHPGTESQQITVWRSADGSSGQAVYVEET